MTLRRSSSKAIELEGDRARRRSKPCNVALSEVMKHVLTAVGDETRVKRLFMVESCVKGLKCLRY